MATLYPRLEVVTVVLDYRPPSKLTHSLVSLTATEECNALDALLLLKLGQSYSSEKAFQGLTVELPRAKHRSSRTTAMTAVYNVFPLLRTRGMLRVIAGSAGQ